MTLLVCEKYCRMAKVNISVYSFYRRISRLVMNNESNTSNYFYRIRFLTLSSLASCVFRCNCKLLLNIFSTLNWRKEKKYVYSQQRGPSLSLDHVARCGDFCSFYSAYRHVRHRQHWKSSTRFQTIRNRTKNLRRIRKQFGNDFR